MALDIKHVISLVMLSSILWLTGCSIGLPWPNSSRRNDEAEYESAKEAIWERIEELNSNSELRKKFSKKNKIKTEHIAHSVRHRLGRYLFMDELPENKGLYRAIYEISANIKSKDDFSNVSNLGRRYLIKGELISFQKVTKQKHYIFRVKEVNTKKEVVFVYYNNPSLQAPDKIQPGINLLLSGYYGGWFALGFKKENESLKAYPTFFLDFMVMNP